MITKEQMIGWPEDFSHENGNYQYRCASCGQVFLGHKRRVECRLCALRAAEPAPEVAELQRLADCCNRQDVNDADDTIKLLQACASSLRQAAALQADAERYRWLRYCLNAPGNRIKITTKAAAPNAGVLSGDELDASIDAARKAAL